MKILMVLDTSIFPLLGGLQRHVWTLAKFMSRQGHEVNILAPKSKLDTTNEVYLNGVRIIKTLQPVRYKKIQWVYDSYSLVKQINDYGKKYDIVHYHGQNQYFFENLNLDRPVVSTIHSISPACLRESFQFDLCQSPSPAKCALCYVANRPNYAPLILGIVGFCAFHQRFIKKGLQKMQRVICVSEYVRARVERALRLDNLITIKNFIDFDGEIKSSLQSLTSFNARKSLDIPLDSRIIVYFGRLSYEKGLDILVKAFDEVLKRLDKRIFLIIGGDGSQKHLIEEMAKNMTNIKMVGYVSRVEQLGLLSQSDIFVSPSRFADACPTTLIEATSLGLPIVATRVGGSPEIVEDKENGLLVEPKNSHALADGLITMLSDESMLHRCKTSGPKKAKNFDIIEIGSKILGLYEEILDQY